MLIKINDGDYVNTGDVVSISCKGYTSTKNVLYSDFAEKYGEPPESLRLCEMCDGRYVTVPCYHGAIFITDRNGEEHEYMKQEVYDTYGQFVNDSDGLRLAGVKNHETFARVLAKELNELQYKNQYAPDVSFSTMFEEAFLRNA